MSAFVITNLFKDLKTRLTTQRKINNDSEKYFVKVLLKLIILNISDAKFTGKQREINIFQTFCQHLISVD